MKKKFSKFLGVGLALVLVLSFSMVTAVPAAAAAPDTLAEGTTYEIVGNYYPVDFIVKDDGPTVTWTFDTIGDKVLEGNGHWGYGLAISLDGEKPAFQIHNNDGTDAAYAWGTHLYSEYDAGWHTGWDGEGDRTANNIPVTDVDWAEATGERDIVANPEGIFTVTIDKSKLGLEFYWAIWCGVGGFYSPNNGYSSYPDGWSWDSPVSAYATATIPPNIEVGLIAEVEQITAINVGPTSIDFGPVTPGTSVSGKPIIVENIGTVKVSVSAALQKPGTVFEGLKLAGTSPPREWTGIIGLAGATTAEVTTQLEVLNTYGAKGVETNTLIFTVRPY